MVGFVPKNLYKLIRSLPASLGAVWEGALPKIAVTGVTYDSRAIEAGYIFICHKGHKVDAHDYIPQALERGAIAVVGSEEIHDLPVPYVRVADAREALAHLAAAFYDSPAHRMSVIGVTGTDGKTTTANLIYNILLAAGLRAGIISTVNAVIGDEVVDTGFHVTTPEAPEVQRYLARMKDAGLTHVVLESTSHGLAQHRVTACEFDIGVITNITHEHLDEHGSFQAYRDAKARLFTMLSDTPKKSHGNPRLAVLNRDDPSYDYLDSVTQVRKAAYSLRPGANLWADEIQFEPDRLSFTAVGADFRLPVHTNLVGEYNVSNCLAALCATVLGLGIEPETAARGIGSTPAVPGRMERIHLGQEFSAIVDFAHTPNALRQVLGTARQMTSGRVIAVFGSAGLRDREKRRMMAEVSSELADLSIFTAEDPRTESLRDILEEMARGAVGKGGVEGHTFFRVPDRREALRLGVKMAQPGDILIVCGKGHEQSMCFGSVEYAWDDREALRAALAELLDIEGPAMPFLPDQAEGW